MFFIVFSHADITVYLLHTTSFATLEEVKNYKSLSSYKYFTAGWIIEHKWKVFREVCLLIGKVQHSYAVSSTPLHLWVIVKNSGTVVCGHCSCMAGLGETCSHIGALLYWVEYQVRKRDEESCTSKPNTWLEPSITKEIPYLELERVDFTSAEKKMKLYQSVEPSPTTTSGLPSKVMSVVTPESDKVKQLFEKCLHSSSTPILFSILNEPYNKNFVHSLEHLPIPLQSIFDPEHLKCNYLELIEIGKIIRNYSNSAKTS